MEVELKNVPFKKVGRICLSLDSHPRHGRLAAYDRILNCGLPRPVC